MRGVFLTVWDFSKDSDTGDALFDDILQTTKGGYPYLTLFYSGRHIASADLAAFVSESVFNRWVTDENVYITHAYVNSFQLGPGGKWRHDCLLAVDTITSNNVDEYRATAVGDRWPRLYAEGKLSMNSPHITAGIHWTLEDAQRQVDAINAKLKQKGPRIVKIVGITI